MCARTYARVSPYEHSFVGTDHACVALHTGLLPPFISRGKTSEVVEAIRALKGKQKGGRHRGPGRSGAQWWSPARNSILSPERDCRQKNVVNRTSSVCQMIQAPPLYVPACTTPREIVSVYLSILDSLNTHAIHAFLACESSLEHSTLLMALGTSGTE